MVTDVEDKWRLLGYTPQCLDIRGSAGHHGKVDLGVCTLCDSGHVMLGCGGELEEILFWCYLNKRLDLIMNFVAFHLIYISHSTLPLGIGRAFA